MLAYLARKKMEGDNRFVYRVVLWADGLIRKYRNSWNGLSVLVMAEDSARPPSSYRINYLILFFIAAIVIVLPAAALWTAGQRILESKGQGTPMSGRIALLSEVSSVNKERKRLFAELQSRQDAYQRISRNYQDVQVAFRNLDPGDPDKLTRASYNSMSLETNEMRLFRVRFTRFMETSRSAMSFLKHRVEIYDIIPRGLAVPKEKLRYIGKYGRRTNPVTGTDTEFHEGIDLIVPHGTPVMATGPGTVIEVQNASDSGYGLFVRIHHGLGYTTLYAHNSENLVEEGDTVKRGQLIGKVGETGRTVGAHLHYEVKLGPNWELEPPYRKRRAEDPTEYL